MKELISRNIFIGANFYFFPHCAMKNVDVCKEEAAG